MMVEATIWKAFFEVGSLRRYDNEFKFAQGKVLCH
jgi:hypothetical protein